MNCKQPITVWITGLPASGKTTLGKALQSRISQHEIPVVLLDGDEVRKGLCSDLGFSPADRTENLRRVASIAALLNSQGVVTICCFVSPQVSMRQMARSIIGKESFFEVFADAPVEVCQLRDNKGNYSKAINGSLSDFTGISSSYEAPVNPNLRLNTAMLSEKEAADTLYNHFVQWVDK
ncbi:MAG TPA: adenylyl-sulfate kinase [Bacteroidales bacterium]|nr:adenylyl-sulfate kinase [Bacteroidales bacterium]